MNKNDIYVNDSQEMAVEKSSVLKSEEMKYAAYRQWPGLSDDTANPTVENEVVNWMAKAREDYRYMTENLEWNYPAAKMQSFACP